MSQWEWQLHPSSWVKWAIYKSFSTFFFSLASWPNFLLPLLYLLYPLGLSTPLHLFLLHHHPGLCSCDLHLDRGSSCSTRMPDPLPPCQPLSSLQPEWSFRITNLMTMSCLLPHKLLISLVVYRCHQERQTPWFDLRVLWGLALCFSSSISHINAHSTSLCSLSRMASSLISTCSLPPARALCWPLYLRDSSPSFFCQVNTHVSSLSSGFTPSNLSSLTSVTKW